MAARDSVGDTMLAWERFLSGHPRAVAPAGNFVVSSWQRSLALGVNPARTTAPLLACGEALHSLRQRHGDLLGASASVFAELGELFAGSRSIMLLTDPDGVVLHAVGDPFTLDQGREINLAPGGAWSESEVGTNGIGAALAAGQPAQVHAAEHFCEGIKRWTCAAAPIYEPGSGAVLGIVDISGPPATYQRTNLALAVSTARQIETVLAERAARARLRLLDACLSRLSATDAPAGLVAIDRAGRLVHAGRLAHAPVQPGERLPGLSAGVPVEDWARLLPEGWRPEWFRPLAEHGETIGAMLVIPTGSRPAVRPSAERTPTGRGSESDPQRGDFAAIVGDSPPMAALIGRARLLAAHRVPVLIEGETGTGKELLARALHGAAGPLIMVNCGAVSRELLAGELFGHVRGAFTGATAEGRPGRFELAHQGTLCLDEIGELPLDLQPTLLRALEEGVIYRLGDPTPRRVDVRLIAMTNRTLRDEVQAGRFRGDLYWRIAVSTLTVPPLRARPGDVARLATHFLRLLSVRHAVPDRAFTPAALAALAAHRWPGNVRELRNLIETALLTAAGPSLDVADLPFQPQLAAGEATHAPVSANSAASLADTERQAIDRALADCRGNLTEAARRLGISRSTLYRKLERQDGRDDASRGG